jgi:type I restriction enzyme S subunit
LGRPFVASGVNFIKSEAITHEGRIDPSSFAFIDLETHEALGRSILEEHDVLFSMAGMYLGKTAVAPRSVLPANTNQAVGIIRVDQTKADPRFVHYALSSPECRALVRRSVAQSAQPNFNLADIGNLPIPTLSLPVQRAVAHILGALDNKIDLNHQMNETLEELARTIFKSWFVDFDPVRAKAEGKRPVGMDAKTAALFPSRILESESGGIPDGWTRGTIGDIVSAVGGEVRTGPFGTMLKAEEYAVEGIPAIAVRDIRVGYVEISSSTPRIPASTAQRLSAFRVRPGDILFGRKGAVERFAVLGSAEDGWLMGSDCIRLRVNEMFAEYLARRFQQESHGRWMHQHATGTTMPSLNQGIIERIPVLIPTKNVVEAFANWAVPLTAKARLARAESRTLAELRDLLLPKLLSGELRVRDAEKLAEAAL